MFNRFLSLIAFVILKLFFRLEIVGVKSIPKRSSFILASNHISNFDPVILAAACPRRLNFLAKEELFHMPILSWLIPRAGALPLKRNKSDISALKESLRRLRNKESLLVFPQGTRSAEAIKVFPGVGFLANKSGAAVIPARIYGADRILPPGKVLPRLKKIKVVFGKSLAFNKGAKAEDIAKDVISAINSL